MVAFFEEHTALQFVDGNAIPDMHGNVPGAGTQGHQVIAAPYDGREVGPLIKRLRKTMRETSFMGMPIMAGADLMAFLSMTRSFKSLLHVSRRFCRHLLDLAMHGRAMQLVNGVALVARLAKSAEKLGVHADRVGAGEALDPGERRRARCRRRHRTRARSRFARRRASCWPQAASPTTCSGARRCSRARRPARSILRCRRRAVPATASAWANRPAARLVTDLASPVAWAPVSKVQYADGSIGHFPHIIDRAKPGVIGVLADGKRFVNEADGYYDYTAAMVAAVPQGQEVASWLICDHRFQRRYGLGFAKPFPLPLTPYLRSGYLKRGASDRGTCEGLRHRAGGAGRNRQGITTSTRGAARIRSSDAARRRTTASKAIRCTGPTRASRRSSKVRSMP